MGRRKQLARFGVRPHSVAVFAEDTASGRYCRAAWRVRGKLTVKSWPDTAEGRREAKAFAEQLAIELRAPAKAPPATLAELWAKYTAAEFEALRPKTQINYRRHWRNWELFAGGETFAQAVTRDTLDGFRQALKARGIAVTQIRKHVDLVKLVYRFAVDRELIPPTRLLEYTVKAAKDERSVATAEYRGDEADRIIAALDPAKSTEWRAWLFCTIARYTGARTNAILHLTWDDVSRAETFGDEAIRWQAQWDKVGKERTQPIPRQVSAALTVAREWREKDGYAGAWIFYTARRNWKGDRPMTYGGVGWMLREAERRAGVAHVRMNAAHRFRRGVVGDIVDATGGNVRLAMSWIGDGVRQAARYVKERDEQLRGVAQLLSNDVKSALEIPTESLPTCEATDRDDR